MLCSLMTFGAGFVTLFEFALVMADDIPTAEIWLRQLHLALFFTILSLVAFIRVYLNAGSRWLIMTIGVLWSCTLIADFVSTESFIQTQISDLYRLETVWANLTLSPSVS